jgi:hypothetical protein
VSQAPKPDGRKGRKNPGSHFAKLSQTPEGRAQLAEWRARRKTVPKRPFGAKAGYTKQMRLKVWAFAHAQGLKLLKTMEAKGYVLPKDQYAREAIETVAAVMNLEDISPKDRLAAARTLLDFTMAKPANETNLNVKKAEDFLLDLANEVKDSE